MRTKTSFLILGMALCFVYSLSLVSSAVTTTMVDPVEANPRTVNSNQDFTIWFDVDDTGSPVTSGVTATNVTIGTSPATIKLVGTLWDLVKIRADDDGACTPSNPGTVSFGSLGTTSYATLITPLSYATDVAYANTFLTKGATSFKIDCEDDAGGAEAVTSLNWLAIPFGEYSITTGKYIKCGTTGVDASAGTVTFASAFPDTNYIIGLGAGDDSDSPACNILDSDNKVAGSFDWNCNDDAGGNELMDTGMDWCAFTKGEYTYGAVTIKTGTTASSSGTLTVTYTANFTSTNYVVITTHSEPSTSDTCVCEITARNVNGFTATCEDDDDAVCTENFDWIAITADDNDAQVDARTQQMWHNGSDMLLNITSPALAPNTYYNLFLETNYSGTISSDTETNAIYYPADTTPPVVTIVFPTAINYTTNVTAINYTVTDLGGVSRCWYSRDAGATNSTSVAGGTNFTGVTSVDGTQTWKVYCNDTAGNVGNKSVTFYREWTGTTLSMCRNLEFAQTYVQSNNISADAGCINVLADNVGINGNGYAIRYSVTTAGKGITVNGYDGFVGNNLNIRMEITTRTGYSDGVWLGASYNDVINNSIFFIEGSDLGTAGNRGIKLEGDVVNVTIQNTYIETDNLDGMGVRGDSGGGFVMTGLKFINSTINITSGASSSCSCGFWVKGSAGDTDSIEIRDSTFYNTGSPSNDMIVIDSASATLGWLNISNIYVDSLGKAMYLSLGSAKNSYIYDSTLISGASDEDFGLSATNTGTVYLTNVTLTDEDEVVSAGTLVRRWYFDAQVNKSDGTAVESANATLWNVTGTQQFSVLTGVNGKIAQQIATAYVNTAGTKSFYNNHEFNVTKDTYTTNSSSLNITANQNLQITLDTGGACSLDITLSDTFSSAVYWDVTTIPSTNLSAEGNNDAGNTEYNVTITASGCTGSLQVKANAPLTSGLNTIPLGNEKWSFNATDITVPSNTKTDFTNSYVNAGTGLASGDVFFKFYLNVSTGQSAGTYNNTLGINLIETV